MNFVFETVSEKNLEQCVNTIFSSMSKRLLPVLGDKETLKSLIYGTHVFTLVAKKEEKIVGTITGTILDSPTIGFLNIADVQSAREGLAGLLIDKFLEAVKKKKPEALFVTTSVQTDNTDAILLYSAKGFEVKGFIEEGLMGKDVAFLRKKL